jgi:hypothetical protein
MAANPSSMRPVWAAARASSPSKTERNALYCDLCNPLETGNEQRQCRRAIAPDRTWQSPVRQALYARSLSMECFSAQAMLSRSRPGRLGYAPGDLLKLYSYGYLNRVRSSRRLEAETMQCRGYLVAPALEAGLQDHRGFPQR